MKYISLAPETGKMLTTVGNWAFFIVVAIFALWVIGTFVARIGLLRGEEA